MGFKDKLKKITYKMGGYYALKSEIDDLNDKLENAYNLLSYVQNISELPKANGDLRNLQVCDTVLLEIFDEMCKQNELTYWLSSGTLLGAVRHNGFIPWDDDLDVSMLRTDYKRAEQILPNICKNIGIDFYGDTVGRFGIGYKHEKTGVWLDVFPWDILNMKNTTKEEFWKKLADYRVEYAKIKDKSDKELIENTRKKFLPIEDSYEKCDSLIFSPDFYNCKTIINKDNLLPLSEMEFEGNSFPVLNNSEEYLKVVYGKNYMFYPHSGVEHHGNDDGKISMWAKNNNIDMNIIKKELEEILASLKANKNAR